LLLLVLVLQLSMVATARADVVLRGLVTDASTGQPLAGVEVRLVGEPGVLHSGADGRFEIVSVQPGATTVTAFHYGYEPAKRDVVVPEAAAGGAPEIEIDIALRPLQYRHDPIVVSSTRVQRRESPVPYSYLSRSDLEDRYTTQDLPVLLSELPSAVYYSENGNGLGYSYLTLRGFDQRRVSVLVNGVPQNDPEDQGVYWIDFPDLSSNLQDVQVQYGAGGGFYGPPAIGGSVNLVTSVFDPKPAVRISTGAGSFDTQRYSLELNSGLVNSTYAFYGRYSRLRSDGYRRDAGVDLTSYFFGAVRYDPDMTTRVHVYGGPIADGLAYYGVGKSSLGDRVRRRDNPLAGGDQIENFSQPHYELLHEWRLSPRLKVSNTLFYVQGDGFFDFDGSWADTTYFRLTQEHHFHPTGNPGNSLIRAFVGNKQGGWLPRVELEHARGQLTAGAELRLHRSLHWGAVRWAQNLPPELTPGRHYYEFRGGKDIASLYAHENYRLTEGLRAMGDLQLVYDRYRIIHEAFAGNDFRTPFTFVNPRLGLNYNLSPRAHAFASYGYVHREPRLNNLYDAGESSGGALPQFERRTGGTFDFGAPLVHPERLHDLEMGGGWRTERASCDLNLFWMDFRDEIVANGQLDRFGQPITGNAARSLHRGLELGARARPWSSLEVQGNVSFSRDLLRDHVVFVDAESNAAPQGIQLGGNRIASFPDFIANLRLTARAHGALASLAGRYAGASFTTNYEETSRKAPPYFNLDGDLQYKLRQAGDTRLHLQARNLLDRLYVLHGAGDEYFPAATRSFFASLEFGL
jgi:iron complex outermembrane receptor protein